MLVEVTMSETQKVSRAHGQQYDNRKNSATQQWQDALETQSLEIELWLCYPDKELDHLRC